MILAYDLQTAMMELLLIGMGFFCGWWFFTQANKKD